MYIFEIIVHNGKDKSIMKNQIKFNHSIFLLAVLSVLFNLSAYSQVDIINNPLNSTEQEKPLSYFNIYRGNTHAHTIFTWTHGAHREKSITDLSQPTKFHPEWIVPRGMDWKNHNSINLNPDDYSNRQGLPANHYALARKNGYDFYVVTDHTQEPTLQPVSIRNSNWQLLHQTADEFDKYPDFVALAGFEYSRNTSADGGSGHINVLNAAEYVNADHGQRGPALPWPEANWNIPLFYGWVKKAHVHQQKGHVVTGFNHPNPKQYDNWAHIDDEIAELISTFEIHSRYNEARWEAYIKALNKGWRVSPIGVLDNHGLDDIENFPPPTYVLAPELTRESITQALRERRTFASWIEGVELRYSVNGLIMGSYLDKTGSYEFNVEISTSQSNLNERVRRIQILRNHSEIGRASCWVRV